MAVGYANGATLAYVGWVGLATPSASAGLVSSVSSPGWTRNVADITSIDAADDTLRAKLSSGRLEPNGITTAFFYDPSATGLDSPPLTANALSIVFPVAMAPVSDYTQNCFVTAYSIGNVIDDEVSVCECEFMAAGGEEFDDPTQV